MRVVRNGWMIFASVSWGLFEESSYVAAMYMYAVDHSFIRFIAKVTMATNVDDVTN